MSLFDVSGFYFGKVEQQWCMLKRGHQLEEIPTIDYNSTLVSLRWKINSSQQWLSMDSPRDSLLYK